MRAKRHLLFSLFAVLLVFGVASGCNKGRSDAQITTDVQKEIGNDASIPSSTVAVQTANGAVTLTGTVSSENIRVAAANDAARVEGVKTVVNNLQVGGAAAAPVADNKAPAETPQAATPEPQPAPAAVTKASSTPLVGKAKPTSARDRNKKGRDQGPSDSQIRQDLASSEAPAGQGQSAPTDAQSQPQAAQNTPPPPPPPPAKVTIPAGTTLSVRLVDGLDSERNKIGDTFHATLNTAIVIDDRVVLPRDADVQGRVVDVKSAGKFAGASNLAIELNAISVNGRTYNIDTNQWSKSGTGEGKKTAAKTGGGALLGAIIGGIAGGGKGAAIGTVAGGAAGAGTAAATNKANQIKLGPEALLSFSLQNPLTVTPQSKNDRNAGREQISE